jgi:hypothetical protein
MTSTGPAGAPAGPGPVDLPSSDDDSDMGQAAIRVRPPVRPLAAFLASQLALGVVIGLVWLRWAPRTISYLVPASDNRTVVIPDESESQIAGDGRFFVLCAVAGLLVGVIAWFLFKRWRGPVALITLTIGATLSSLLARIVGESLSSGTRYPAVRSMFHPALVLHAGGLLWVQALFAVAVYLTCAGLTADADFVASRTPESTPPPPQVSSPHPR